MSSKLIERKWHTLQNFVKTYSWEEDPQLISDLMDQYINLCNMHPELSSREFATPDFWKAFAEIKNRKEEEGK